MCVKVLILGLNYIRSITVKKIVCSADFSPLPRLRTKVRTTNPNEASGLKSARAIRYYAQVVINRV